MCYLETVHIIFIVFILVWKNNCANLQDGNNKSRFSTITDSTDTTNARVKGQNENTKIFIIPVPANELAQMTLMANYAMQTLDGIDEDDHRRVVLKVDDAKKELTNDGSGIMYYLNVIFQDTLCPEMSPYVNTQYVVPNVQLDDCLNQVTGEARICKIHLLRSWVPNSSPVNAHVVKSECGAPIDT